MEGPPTTAPVGAYEKDSNKTEISQLLDLIEASHPIQSQAVDEIEKAMGDAEALGKAFATLDISLHPPLVTGRNQRSQPASQASGRGMWESTHSTIELIEAVLHRIPVDSPHRAMLLHKLCILYYKNFDFSENREHISKAIELSEQALKITPIGDPARVGHLTNQSVFWATRYERFAAMQDLENAIARAIEALDLIPTEHGSRAPILGYLSNYFCQKYQRLGGLENCEMAIMRAREGLAMTLPDSLERPRMLITLSNALTIKYELLGTVDDIDESISLAQDAVASPPGGHPDRTFFIQCLTDGLRARTRTSGLLEDLDRSVELAEEAVLFAPIDDNWERAARLDTLGDCLSNRHERFGVLKDLQMAVERAQEALEIAPADHPDRWILLANLSNHLFSRYERLGILQDLDTAIERAEEALSYTTEGQPQRGSILDSLSQDLRLRYERLADQADLESAIERAEEAVTITSTDRVHIASRSMALSMALVQRFDHFGVLDDLHRAIRVAEESLSSIPRGNPRLANWLSSLSNSLFLRYERLGTMDDLDNAIKHVEEALSVAPADCSERPSMLRNLSTFLCGRFQQTGVFDDIERAIKRAEKAVSLTPTDHPDRSVWLANLSKCLTHRYKRLDRVQDLIAAIELAEEALALTPEYHQTKMSLSSNLGNLLTYKYQNSRATEDLQASLRHHEAAVKSIPIGHPYRAGVLHNLSNDLSEGYDQFGILELLDKAIELQETAAEITTAEHPHYGWFLHSLGMLIVNRYKNTARHSDIFYAIGLFQVAKDSTSSQASVRISSARICSSLLTLLNKWDTSSSLLAEAIKLLPLICPRSLGRDDLQDSLSEHSQLASEAASTAFNAGMEASHCLSLLELGRGIIMGLAIDCRSDQSDLRDSHLELFNRFDSLRSEVDSTLDFDEGTYEDDRVRRLQAASELGKILEDIRQLPGFQSFLLPPPAVDLVAMANEGPIVVINSTKFSSDAIIVTSSGIERLPLPGLKHDELIERMKHLRENIIRGQRSTKPLRNRELNVLLMWLWDVVVGPVCKKLNLEPIADDGPLPRVWWIGVGLLSTAPFHAAGDHSPGSRENIISRAISSYIPTIKALSYAREGKLDPLAGTNPNLLVVTMPTTPGHKNLRGVTVEYQKIASVVGGDENNIELMEHPTAALVLEKLKSYQAVHFSCHGVPDTKNPSNSRLLLRTEENEGPTVDPLTVGAISGINLRRTNAQLAYLSACSTAVNRSGNLSDEVIHIASAFQLAGFSHVLATLWTSEDSASKEVAVEFYRLLFDNQGVRGHTKVGYSFHYAVKKLREKFWRQPILWACFIHTGA